ncbi:MAG: PEP/pyruvate-binding domain-containing protein, partial [Nitrososphaerales archaeon]
MKSGYIRSLDEITKDDVRVAGGKGANLGEMYRSKLPVPEAFVVTTKAYRAFAESNGLDGKLQERLKGIRMEDVGSVERGAAELRKMVESSDIPKDLEAEVALAYRELGKKFGSEDLPVAVRSSATTEDLRDSSFAGQQITMLNVKGSEEVLVAMRKCWASVYTA